MPKQISSFTVYLIGIAVLTSSPGIVHGQDDLDIRMESVGADFGGGKLTEAQVEEKYSAIQKEAKSARDKGKVYKHLAYTLAVREKQKNGDKIIKYAELALQQPLDKLDLIQANILLAEGLGYKYHGATGKAWAESKREIVAPYLRGLKIVLDNLTQSKRIDPPGVNPYVCPDADKTCQQLKANYQKEVAERARVDFQNHLIENRDVIVRGCIAEYSANRKDAPDPDLGELERNAGEVLTPVHSDVVKMIVDKVRVLVASRKEGENSQNEKTKRDQATFPVHPDVSQTHIKHAAPVTSNTEQAPQ